MRAFCRFVGAALLLVGLAGPAWADSLPKLAIDADHVTVSGISSGAYMANQFHVAHSARVDGAGLVAGGLYGCAVSTVVNDKVMATASRALAHCMRQSAFLESADRFVGIARQLERAGAIDALAGLRGDRVYLFTGEADTVVGAKVVRTAAEALGTLGVTTTLVSSLQGTPGAGAKAGHAFLTPDRGNAACSAEKSPFFNACRYDQAEAILKVLYGPSLAPPAPVLSGRLSRFDQSAYVRGGNAIKASLWDEGLVYVPADCAAGAACRLHIAFHGCKQSDQVLGSAEKFWDLAGYNGWADTNHIVVLYPQARAIGATEGFPLTAINPEGCWNWWGYGLDGKFLGREGLQISAVNAMINALAGR
ncbi:periplasmatic short-chain-length polyhydroxyalkanoate depolymerase PhaZ1 [Rhodospirillum rubrum]|uniref:Depolymerase n=2 Tax=Rhodospirillum rubrum TaxID=1085 RepID=Q2RU10_RHORT|nr:depolymerase [Rhodospirillum rubrum]AAL30107.1 poly(3-hydroxyalkanoate) depolymerase precursor [Rhodospirillum rubrum]ABC22385.1 putative depolymerase [Rhodospirillum rubrum ATCC 11170]AEO48102.1 putative depolymerase [Rhodospirillum rubrum F11]MBK5953966.1 depolymerase [Rhodospirillum rubrum]QXG82022.1 depolymerase [Rhodospirillum rubrum]